MGRRDSSQPPPTDPGPPDVRRSEPDRAGAVEQLLDRTLEMDGLVAASLIEPTTGQVLGALSASEAAPTEPDTAALLAAAATDIVQALRAMSAGTGGTDDLEDVMVTIGRRHHMIRMVQAGGGDGLALLVTLDRDRTNLGLARRQVPDLGLGSRP